MHLICGIFCPVKVGCGFILLFTTLYSNVNLTYIHEKILRNFIFHWNLPIMPYLSTYFNETCLYRLVISMGTSQLWTDFHSVIEICMIQQWFPKCILQINFPNSEFHYNWNLQNNFLLKVTDPRAKSVPKLNSSSQAWSVRISVHALWLWLSAKIECELEVLVYLA